jgi:hypothetical protein
MLEAFNNSKQFLIIGVVIVFCRDKFSQIEVN